MAAVIGGVSDFIQTHQVLAGTITAVVTALGLYLTALGAYRLALEPMAKLIYSLATGFVDVAAKTKVAT
jgi:hypothetical protein